MCYWNVHAVFTRTDEGLRRCISLVPRPFPRILYLMHAYRLGPRRGAPAPGSSNVIIWRLHYYMMNTQKLNYYSYYWWCTEKLLLENESWGSVRKSSTAAVQKSPPLHIIVPLQTGSSDNALTVHQVRIQSRRICTLISNSLIKGTTYIPKLSLM